MYTFVTQSWSSFRIQYKAVHNCSATCKLLVLTANHNSQTTYVSKHVRCFVKVNQSKVDLTINICCSIEPRACHYFKLFFGLPSTKHIFYWFQKLMYHILMLWSLDGNNGFFVSLLIWAFSWLICALNWLSDNEILCWQFYNCTCHFVVWHQNCSSILSNWICK